MGPEGVVGIAVLAIVGVIIFFTSISIVPQTERGLVERWGKYNRFIGPGLHFVIPLADQVNRVDITEQMIDAESQYIITKDKLNAKVDAQIYFKVKDNEDAVKATQYSVNDYERQIVAISRTTLRNIIGSMTLNDANSDRDKINKELLLALSKETKSWGIEVVRTELKEIDPPQDVQNTMNKVVIAENEKIAALDFAKAAETKADGLRMAAIKEAEGKAKSVTLAAQAEAEAIKLVNDAANKHFIGQAVELKRIEAMQRSLQDNSKIVIVEKGLSPQLIIGDGVAVVRGKKQ